jgi:hypothetical protein
MVELEKLVRDFARGLAAADARHPQSVGVRTGKIYQPGIGPHTETQTLKLVLSKLSRIDQVYVQHSFDVPYRGSSRQRCDWCLGTEPDWDWTIEAKMLRLLGDNGKLNDNMLMHILSPYPAHRSALTDCAKLATSTLNGRKAVLIFGYEYEGWELAPAVEAFETLARERIVLGPRNESPFMDLVHPVHQPGAVFAWEIASE